MQNKVLITSRMFGILDAEPLNILLEAGLEIVPNPYRGTILTEEQLLELVEDIDAAIVGDDYFTAKVMEKAPKLKVISKYGVGVDRIDVARATDKGIVVTNAPLSNKHAVADMAFALMLTLSRQISQAMGMVRQGGWKVVIGREVYGKTLGIVGLGQIGKEVAKRAKGFEMDILAYEPYPDAEFVRQFGVRLVTLEELLAKSDIVSLHLPSFPSTKGIIGRNELALMKPTAYLINTARGDLVDEQALLGALREERIAGAALDTLALEPPGEHPLIGLSNVVITPHTAAHTYESNYKMGMTAARNTILVLRSEKPLHLVNPEVYGT